MRVVRFLLVFAVLFALGLGAAAATSGSVRYRCVTTVTTVTNVVSTVVSTVTVTVTDTTTSSTSTPSSSVPFDSSSVWNKPIQANPTLRSDSAQIVNYVVAHANYPNLPLTGWGMPVYVAQPSDPTYDVQVTLYQGNLGSQGPIPIPANAAPDPESDGHMVIVDPASGLTWGMWQARKTPTGWEASAGEVVSLTGPGLLTQEGQIGSNAAGFPLLAGVIRPFEIAQGHIDHALTFTVPGVSSLGHVWPAVHNDGSSTDPSAPMEGMRFQLDPSVDVSSLGGTAYCRTIARALQVYGAFLRDEGGTIAFGSDTGGSWTGVSDVPSGVEVAPLSCIPWGSLRVVAASTSFTVSG